MKNYTRTSIVFLAGICLSSQSTLAKDAENKQTTNKKVNSDFETVVVTGTRTEHSYLDAPVKVEVITEELLKEQHAFDLSEGIKTIPNIQIKGVTGKEGQEAWIQGISANRVLVLVNGERVSASTGSAVDLTQIIATDIKRIEVVKGASSALYGSQAMGGVINVITKTPAQGIHGRISLDGGSYGDRNPASVSNEITRERYAGNVSYADELFYMRGDFNLRYSNGFQTNNNSWNQEGPDGHKNTAALLLGLTPSDDSEYKIRYEKYDQELHARYVLGNNFEEKVDNADRERLSLSGDWHINENHQLIIKGFHEKYTAYSEPSLAKSRDADMPMSHLDSQWNYTILENLSFTAGVQAFTESLDQTVIETGLSEVDNESRNNKEIFSQIEWGIGPITTLVPGIRSQYDSDFGSHTSPKISLKVDPTDNLFIRASIGDGYRVPNLKERYYVFDHSHIGYKVIGNPELEPEQSVSQQVQFVFTDNNKFQAELGFFRNDLTDLIETSYVRDEGNVVIYQYTNTAEAITQGVEVSGSYSFIPEFKLYGGYTYLYSKDTNKDHELNDRPEHQLKINISYFTPWGMDIALLSTWQSKAYEYRYDPIGNLTSTQKSEAWAQYDLKLTQEVAQWSTQILSVYGGIDNITDEIKDFQNTDFDNRPEVGRVIYLGANYEF